MTAAHIQAARVRFANMQQRMSRDARVTLGGRALGLAERINGQVRFDVLCECTGVQGAVVAGVPRCGCAG